MTPTLQQKIENWIKLAKITGAERGGVVMDEDTLFAALEDIAREAREEEKGHILAALPKAEFDSSDHPAFCDGFRAALSDVRKVIENEV